MTYRTSLLPSSKPFEEMNEIERLGYLVLIIEPIERLVVRLWTLIRIGGVAIGVLLVAVTVFSIQVNSRNRQISDLRRDNGQTAQAARAAQQAAAKTDADLLTAIASARTVDQASLEHALTEITCIAHQAYPCP